MFYIYSIIYLGALLYEYIVKSFMFALSNFSVKFYEKYYKKIENQSDLENLTINIHKILNFIYYRNFLINLILFMTAWNYYLQLHQVLWNFIAFPIASFFFILIGLRGVGDISDSIYIYGSLLFLPYAIAFISTIVPFPHGFWSIMMTFVPLIIIKQIFYPIYVTIFASHIKEIFDNKEEQEEYIQKHETKIRNLHFGWFSIPMVLFGLWIHIFAIFSALDIKVNSYIVFYIIFIIGVRSAGGFIALIILLRTRIEEFSLRTFFGYIYLYAKGSTTDEIEVDNWLKKVVLHSIIASFLIALILKIF